MNPSEYLYPSARTMTLHIPMVSGYTTGRLAICGLPSDPSIVRTEDRQTHFVLENTGDGVFTVQLFEANHRDPSSGRTALGSAVTLVPNGHKVMTATPASTYLEFKATSTSGKKCTLRVQLTSKLKWDIMAVGKSEQPAAWNFMGYGELFS